MKKIFLFALMLATCVACDDNDNGPDYEDRNDEIVNGRIVDDDPMEFLGTMTVTNPDGTTFVNETARFDIVGDEYPTPLAPATTLTVYMRQMRFAAAMPALEMRINALTYTPGVGPNLTFATAGPVVPQAYIAGAGAGWTNQANYPITDLNGAINNVQCTLEFTCMSTHRVKFEGRMID